MQERASGVLLHPTSLSGPWGIGGLGPAAHEFLDWLSSAGQSVWQVLPLGPTGGGDSPYGATSSFAGNPLLISPRRLIEEDLLPGDALGPEPAAGTARVNFAQVRRSKDALLRRSWAHVQDTGRLREEMEAFEDAPENRDWLGDWSLYAALRLDQGERSWTDWPSALARRRTDALEASGGRLREEIRYQTYLQFLFARQWLALREHARDLGIRILGDLPIYVAHDSADVWAHQEIFELDPDGRPTAVAGVPPDAFTTDGQLWGHPLYRWQDAREDCFDWWIQRLTASLRQLDLLRLDHFRGFAAFWRVPAGAETAREGEWIEGPGAAFFQAVEDRLGSLPLIAEDLGVITEDVTALREQFGLPGMRVLQFAFDQPGSPHLVAHHSPGSVVYSATHDNDTTTGWFDSLSSEMRQRVLALLEDPPGNGVDSTRIHWKMVYCAMTSPAWLAIIPAQDLLGLGSEARMNVPGVADGNWSWRLAPGQLDPDLAQRLRQISASTGRFGES